MSIRFITSGLQTSLQDSGRSGQMQNGIARSGAMDNSALQIANWLVSNSLNAPAIEITLTGPKIEFLANMSIAIAGAEFELFLNGNMVFNNEVISVKKGDLLEFDNRVNGARAYLAFSADVDLTNLLNSFSTNLTAQFGGFKGRAFQKNDHLPLKNFRSPPTKILPTSLKTYYSGNYLFRCVKSVESEWFEAPQWQQFFSQAFQVSAKSNRMGIRLSGTTLKLLDMPQIKSGGVVPGSIQIPASGEPIIAAVDGQTIGGYPRIANVISCDLDLLGQLVPDDKVNFVYIERKHALTLYQKKLTHLKTLIND